MSRRMFIDAVYPEEVRVAITEDGDLKEFESENTTKVRAKGNVYLAKVVKVEPSLQAVFVDYGADRHGFLGLNEIHPDYYQIPVNDKEEFERRLAEISQKINKAEEAADNLKQTEDLAGKAEDAPSAEAEIEENGAESSDGQASYNDENASSKAFKPQNTAEADIEKLKAKFYRKYKIQEVIKPRQILLVQLVKEERGGKCAALTTYISLAGRYCVFMPNSQRPNGISRRISDQEDRSRIRDMLKELMPDKFGSIVVRTAGTSSNRQEIKRDYEGLLRLWNNIRDTTMQSTAPCLVHEEENFVKRMVRDLYTSDTEEILVEGEEVYKQIKQFMKSVTPSHLKRVKLYKDQEASLFNNYKIEGQIEKIYQSEVMLKSGGYLVIHPTEALVAIDVNSGKATRERNMEETAFKTNLEAAEEVARQIRLRDLAGLIVVDFIDIGDKRNMIAIERRMRETLKADRSRVQIAGMSQFGLLEISRQRLRPSITESSTMRCPHCRGSGVIRSVESMAIQLIRRLESDVAGQNTKKITLHTSPEIGNYLLNYKRKDICAIEAESGICIFLNLDSSLPSSEYKIESEQDGKSLVAISAGEASDRIANQKDSKNDNDVSNAGKKSSRRRRRRNRNNNPLTDEAKIMESGDKKPNLSDGVDRSEDRYSPNPSNKVAQRENSSDTPRFELVPQGTASAATNNGTTLENKKRPFRRRKGHNRLENSAVAQQEAGSAAKEPPKVEMSYQEKLPKADNRPDVSIDEPPKKGWWRRILK